MANEMAASGNVIRGSSNGCASSTSVSPVWVSFSFWTTPISPGPRLSTFLAVLPWSHEMWLIRSLLPRVGLTSVDSVFNVPLKARESERLAGGGVLHRLEHKRRHWRLRIGAPGPGLFVPQIGARHVSTVGG